MSRRRRVIDFRGIHITSLARKSQQKYKIKHVFLYFLQIHT